MECRVPAIYYDIILLCVIISVDVFDFVTSGWRKPSKGAKARKVGGDSV